MASCIFRDKSRKVFNQLKRGEPGSHYILMLMLNPPSSLKTRGLTISDKGVSIKTSKRFDREDYVDATQRYVAIHVSDNLGSHLGEGAY